MKALLVRVTCDVCKLDSIDVRDDGPEVVLQMLKLHGWDASMDGPDRCPTCQLRGLLNPDNEPIRRGWGA